VAEAKVSDANLNILDPYEILTLRDERKNLYAYRDASYELFQTYYRGRQGSIGPSVQGSNAQGRPLLRLSESPNKQRAYTSQRLAPRS